MIFSLSHQKTSYTLASFLYFFSFLPAPLLALHTSSISRFFAEFICRGKSCWLIVIVLLFLCNTSSGKEKETCLDLEGGTVKKSTSFFTGLVKKGNG